MANELLHAVADRAAAGTVTQAEFDSITAHRLNSQAIGDMIYASTTSQLRRLAIGATNDLLQVVGGVPTWQAFLALGATPAAAGSIRLPTGVAGGIRWKNAAGDGDASIIYVDASDYLVVSASAGVGVKIGSASGDLLGFYGGAGTAKQTITGSRGGNAALADLLTSLAGYGLITDSSTA